MLRVLVCFVYILNKYEIKIAFKISTKKVIEIFTHSTDRFEKKEKNSVEKLFFYLEN